MIEFKQILCPVDLSDFSVRALAHAAALARWYDGQLTVLHVAPIFTPAPLPGDVGYPVTIVDPIPRQQVVEDVRSALDLPNLAPHAIVEAEYGDPPTTIVNYAISRTADLIVMGTHGRRGFKRMLLGSVTETVLREAPCPVLTVPPTAQETPADAVTFKRILCPIDFSASAVQAFGYALDLARQADGGVTLLHVVEWLAEETRMSPIFAVPDYRRFVPALDEYRREMATNAEGRLQALIASEPRTWSEIEALVTFGRAHREVLRVASTKASDLIVMGAQGSGGVELAFFGSTTQQVVRDASCPVLTVRVSQPA